MESRCRIDFIIVGGGPSGLATAFALKRVGHNVTVLERAAENTVIGGGCKLTPNASKVLLKWGLREELEKRGMSGQLDTTLFYSGDPEEFLGEHHYAQDILRESGGGEWVFLSYSDLRELLANACTKSGVVIRSGVHVTDIDPETQSVLDADGNTYTGDVIIAADGPQGLGRKLLGGAPGVPYGYAYYSAVLYAEDAEKVPQIKGGPEAEGRNAWYIYWGDGWCLYHNVYNTRGDRAIYVFVADDEEGPGETWLDGPCVGLNTLLKDKYVPEWMRSLFELTSTAIRCQNYEYEVLEDWVPDDDIHFLAVGCAAHPFPQGSMQSFGMMFEDAGVLGKLFSHLQAKEQIPNLLYGFQDIRQNRCEMVIEREKRRSRMFTLRKGPEQEERDAQIRKLGKEPGADLGLYSLEEPEKLFSYDCEDQGEDWWHSWGVLHSRTHQIEESPETLAVELAVEIKTLEVGC
ncbi:hypothetical protein BDY19DRAFT_759910 [Irpex rosettiformis]|uniref:Uncharacterized protein n=1 Tax=Irpex rosettiformis TaxID=378272 RepID=A0ACB8U7L6_9APHY|nr:hypothetical protein BDY19DRAFT_759910 [Irpex rosettiformis]